MNCTASAGVWRLWWGVEEADDTEVVTARGAWIEGGPTFVWAGSSADDKEVIPPGSLIIPPQLIVFTPVGPVLRVVHPPCAY